MTTLLDQVLVAIIVTLSFLFVLFTLSPRQIKKWLLSLVARYLGLRALLLVLPKQCGCDGCDVASDNKHKLAAKSASKFN